MIIVAQDEGRQRSYHLLPSASLFSPKDKPWTYAGCVTAFWEQAPDPDRKVAWAGIKYSPGGWLADHQQLWTHC